MHRLGEPCHHLEEIVQIFTMKHLRVEGIFTHLCTADSPSPRRPRLCPAAGSGLPAAAGGAEKTGDSLPKVHLQASHGLLNYPDISGDYARVGIALYGLLSTQQDWNAAAPPLRPVLSLHARVAAVKSLPAGAGAGYGLAFVAQRPTQVAVLTIGYGDGLPLS